MDGTMRPWPGGEKRRDVCLISYADGTWLYRKLGFEMLGTRVILGEEKVLHGVKSGSRKRLGLCRIKESWPIVSIT